MNPSRADSLDPNGSIRPRNRRLISTEQELVSTSATSTPGGSRAASPIPSKYPSRSVSKSGQRNGQPVGGRLAPPQEGRGGLGRSSSPLGFGGGVWEGGWMGSWTKLQGIANSVLSAVEGDSDSDVNGSSSRGKTGLGKVRAPSKWGPSSSAERKDGGIGMGSTDEREAALIQRKRAGVLEGRDEDRIKDMSGNYKRRTSTEEQRPAVDEDDQALVYIHHVQEQDTLQGVILRYNCRPDVFRKANRFWPNDSIQIRKTVILPVDACTVKGRPCDPPNSESPPQGVDLLDPTAGLEEAAASNGSPWPGGSNGKSADVPEESENPWVHVRWVLIDSSPNSKPVEIARMPRKTLGYFPPRRRKSQVVFYSDITTPRGSSEFPRLSQSPSNGQTASTTSTPSRRTSNQGPRPSQSISSTSVTSIGSYFPPLVPNSSTRPRRESVGEAADRLGWMRGPGGVGTFGKNVRRPGPGNDGLNSWARKHIPGLSIEDMPSSFVPGDSVAHFGFKDELASIAESSRNNPGSSSSGLVGTSGSGQNLGLETAAAAIEGWVRRMASATPGTPMGGPRSTPEPDLIELLDGTGSDDGRGFEISPGRVRSGTPIGMGTGRDDMDALVRGANRGVKGGKSD
ncbi:uncharacterized protein L3040_001880 [Drepanopeziza brunnea f. sp. 'multigermtubi']|uniref:LysM domain-containing protein n=1 Tax=Marssonina brunnea f. sp. multigermtubi (strain MB_m1) TaxID=1072389 RepID=K1WQ77_MARBU|nr:LysM domain-containing protein [Drepanopeziza brunnea f. sp. 'multigermtubi' MB_m1]EKD19775.1 LysM domain-containing protein [Drepanopeziza brunnea f. sp. 'multigermtubi' MB_m1]KAJ5052121.1 hypothetical protein L3040_001880 [Drepanopeziza brunnea f. sp. 'multigermtubi']